MRAVIARLGPPAPWLAFLVATQSWSSWGEGIRRGFSRDVTSYETIARAAPHLPQVDVPLQHAERFAPHWLVGAVADALGLPLHDVYRAATYAVLLATVLVVDRTIVAAGGGTRARWVGAGLLAASAYPAHYLLSAPGMLGDAAFLLGFAIALYGFASGRPWVVVAALVGATLARQTAVPLALVAAACLAVQRRDDPRRSLVVAACVLAPLATYVALHEVASGFAQPDNAGVSSITVVGSLDDPRALGEHVARTFLGVLVPAAAVAALAAVNRRRLPWVPLLLAATVLAETLALGPGWTAHNEPRLAALSLPGLAVAGGLLAQRARLGLPQLAALSLAAAAASLHHLYSRLPTDRSPVWVALSLLGACAAVAAVLAPARLAGVAEPEPVVQRPHRPLDVGVADDT